MHLALAVVLASAAPAVEDTADEPPPNVVLIVADDLGYADLGCTWTPGESAPPPIRTPHLDRIAQRGVLLTSFYSASSLCTPARAALLTGCYPPRIGMGRVASGGVLQPGADDGLPQSETTLAEVLGERGYVTHLVGKWHLGDRPGFLPTDHGFESFFGTLHSNDMPPLTVWRNREPLDQRTPQRRLTQRFTKEAVRFIEENAKRPFFLMLSHTAPHVPLFVPRQFRGRSARGLYGDVVEHLDWSTGRIVSTLERLALLDRTLVVFLSDNGPWLRFGEHAGSAHPYGGGKSTTREGGQRVPCVAMWPERLRGGRVVDELVTSMDILPTIAAWVGGTLPEHPLDGADVGPLLAGVDGARSPHEWFAYYLGGDLHAVRMGRWKYVVEHRERPSERSEEQIVPAALFDLDADPGETTDRSREEHEVIQRLTERVAAVRADLGDDYRGIVGRGVRQGAK